jgi:hypothetical protein
LRVRVSTLPRGEERVGVRVRISNIEIARVKVRVSTLGGKGLDLRNGDHEGWGKGLDP